MTEHVASRTLVKSPPELWAECSDAASLARHLDQFGEIRITRLEPETAVAWEGERARGTVRIEPSGWGTKVILTAVPVADEEVAAVAAEESAAEPAPVAEPVPDAEPVARREGPLVAEAGSRLTRPAATSPIGRDRRGALSRRAANRHAPRRRRFAAAVRRFSAPSARARRTAELVAVDRRSPPRGTRRAGPAELRRRPSRSSTARAASPTPDRRTTAVAAEARRRRQRTRHRSHRRRAHGGPRQPRPGAPPAVLARLGAGGAAREYGPVQPSIFPGGPPSSAIRAEKSLPAGLGTLLASSPPCH